MYLIALCDDEPADIEKTEEYLHGYEKKHSGLDFMIRHFENADELLYLVKKENYIPDVIFMDIYMPDKKNSFHPVGLEAAKKLRDMDYKGDIIFLTTSKEYALEAFDVNALQYLVKPVAEEKLLSLLDNLLKDRQEEQKKYILLRIEGRLVRVSVNDIVYCEAQRKTQCLYFADGTQCTLRMTMTEIYEQLSHYQGFVRIGVAFIVNLGYIGSLNAKEVCMDNGMKIYLPRGTYKTLKEQYFNYYCQESE
ncbi:MAG: LytTR family DNA-binding domain-containing protein [Clostridium sp.]|nr:LytTR family DNA-binding domain-containing protein [Lachnoclostridium sp.]MCM1251570.1 LytTR family DNA-binding domain-containing protein [Clostridium sp.]